MFLSRLYFLERLKGDQMGRKVPVTLSKVVSLFCLFLGTILRPYFLRFILKTRISVFLCVPLQFIF